MAIWGIFIKFWKENVTVEPAVLLYMTAIFMEIIITQDLIFSKLCISSTNVTDVLDCHNISEKNDLESETTRWISYNSASMFIFSVISASYVGSWSDRFSRKYTMLIPSIGSILACVGLIINGAYLEWPIGYLLVAGFLTGLSGGITAFLASAFGYLADITTPANRTLRIVILEAMIFLGGTVGMFCGGALNKYLKVHQVSINSFSVVFLVEISLLILTTLYICCCIRDPNKSTPMQTVLDSSTVNQNEICSTFYKLFNLSHIVLSVKTVFKPRADNARAHILMLLATCFLVFSSLGVQQAILFQFVGADPLKWSPEMYSYYNATSFAISGLALIVGLPLAFHFFHVRDTTLGMLGVLSKMAGLILLGFSTNTTLAYMTTVLFIFSEYPVPAIRSILSKIVEPDEKGKIFAFVQLLQSCCFLISSQVFSHLYLATIPFFRGLSFEIVAILEGIAFCMLFYLHHKMKYIQTPYEAIVENPEYSPNENT